MELDEIEQFIDRSPQGTIFTRPGWLEAVAPGRWDYILIKSGDRIRAMLPTVEVRKLRYKIFKMPPLTQSIGILFPPSESKYVHRISEQTNALQELIDQIPNFHFFSERFHPTFTNWLPFYWNGFSQTTRYTYVLKDLSDTEKIWKNMRSNIRREIRKAQKIVNVVVKRDIDRLVDMVFKTFARQKMTPGFTTSTLVRIHEYCHSNNWDRIFFAEDTKGNIHASLYLIFDPNSAYYLIGGSDPDLRTSGAMSLLMWEAIQFAATVTKQFNFEGSMIRPIERFFRAFGGEQVPYFEISKSNSMGINILRQLQQKFSHG